MNLLDDYDRFDGGYSLMNLLDDTTVLEVVVL